MLGLGLQVYRRIVAVGGSIIAIIWSTYPEKWEEANDVWNS